MPPKVAYWTGTWDPQREAISKEIDMLRGLSGRHAPVVAFSSGHSFGLDISDRVVRVPAAGWPLLSPIAAMVERSRDVNHVFGALDAWHLLRAVRRRPIVLTVALPGRPPVPAAHGRVSLFAAESEVVASSLLEAGIPAERVRLVYPGVDLHQYRIGSPPLHPFRILFASTPADPAEFADRGITLLVEVARACPDMEVVLLWRSWGDRDAAQQALDRLSPPANLCIERRNGRTMAEVYQSVHAIACLYADGFGKSCPNSVVEALACGVPALVADSCGIAGLVQRGGAGLAVPRIVEDVAAAARALRDRQQTFGRAARLLAEEHFAVGGFLQAYQRLYEEAFETAPRRPAMDAVAALTNIPE